MPSFAERLIAAHQAGLADRRQAEEHAQRQEEFKLAQQAKKLELDQIKLASALHERTIQGLTSGGPSGQATVETPNIQPPAIGPETGTPAQTDPALATSINDLLMRIRQHPIAPIPAPIQGLSQSAPVGLPPALPDIPVALSSGRTITVPGTNKEMMQADAQAQALQALLAKVAETQATEQAKAPFAFHELTPGAQGVIGAGTPGQTTIQGPPAKVTPDTPTVERGNVTVNGKGPVPVFYIKHDNGKVDVLDANTMRPVQGTIGTYERPREGNPLAQDNRLDKSYQFNAGELSKLAKPVDDAIARLGRLEDSLSQNTPQADALIAPELLTVMAGGAGSGLRMNEAEISRIVGGRSNFESLKAALNKWQLDPTKALSITPAQRDQIRRLVATVADKLRAKQDVLTQAGQDLVNANDVNKHRQVIVDTKKALTDVDANKAKPDPLGIR